MSGYVIPLIRIRWDSPGPSALAGVPRTLPRGRQDHTGGKKAGGQGGSVCCCFGQSHTTLSTSFCMYQNFTNDCLKMSLYNFFFPMRGTITGLVNRRHYLILAYEALRDLIPATQPHASERFTAPQSLQFPHPHLRICSASPGTPTSHPTSVAQPSALQGSA